MRTVRGLSVVVALVSLAAGACAPPKSASRSIPQDDDELDGRGGAAGKIAPAGTGGRTTGGEGGRVMGAGGREVQPDAAIATGGMPMGSGGSTAMGGMTAVMGAGGMVAGMGGVRAPQGGMPGSMGGMGAGGTLVTRDAAAPSPDTLRVVIDMAAPVAMCAPSPLPDEVIANFGSNLNSTIAVAGRAALPFSMALDGSAGTATIAGDTIIPMRCGSSGALKFAGQGFTTWGSIAQTWFVARDKVYDTTPLSFKGLQFSLRSTAAAQLVRLKVPDRQTHEGVPGHLCVTGKCSDHFGQDLVATPIWKTFRIPFSDMRQGNYSGRDQFAAIALDALMGIEFAIPQNQTFELWIDDIAFYR